MSQLNIPDLFETSNRKNLMRLEIYDDVLVKCHKRIKYNSTLERTYCFYQIPEFIIGVPLYKVEEMRIYIINSLKKQGVGIIYNSHRIEEVFNISDRITVMRDGEFIGTKLTKGTEQKEIISMMIGRELNQFFPEIKSKRNCTNTIKERRNLHKPKANMNKRIKIPFFNRSLTG